MELIKDKFMFWTIVGATLFTLVILPVLVIGLVFFIRKFKDSKDFREWIILANLLTLALIGIILSFLADKTIWSILGIPLIVYVFSISRNSSKV